LSGLSVRPGAWSVARRDRIITPQQDSRRDCRQEPLWFFLAFIPIGNIIAAWVVSQELAKKFGKSEGFGIGLFFLGPIFLAILAFGDAEYRGGRRRYDEDDDEDDHDRPRKKKRGDDNW
jgi:hypothetical protein